MPDALTPEDELGLLLELAETEFGLSEPENVEWYRAQPPGESPTFDALRHLESQGYAELVTEWREDAQKKWIFAKVTPTGRKRMQEAGVEPSASWSDLSFDEQGSPTVPIARSAITQRPFA